MQPFEQVYFKNFLLTLNFLKGSLYADLGLHLIIFYLC